jgi:2-methylcitrate dehydratase
MDTIIKPRSACATTLSSIMAAELAAVDLDDGARVESVLVEGYDRVVHLAEEWSYHPDTRETADHSVPYVVAAALLDGTVTPATFAEDRLWDPKLRSLIQKVKVVPDDAFNAGYRKLPLEHGTRVTVTTTDGARHVGEIQFLKGGLSDPMTDAEIEAKFRTLSADYLKEPEALSVLQSLWALEEMKDVGDLPPAFSFQAAGGEKP